MTRLYPLTSPQREIWFEQQLHEGIPLYNIGGYVKLPGAIDPRLFEQAVNLLVQKHDTLRTVLTEVLDEDGIPLQTYVADLTVTVAVQDVSANAQPHEAAMTWMQQRFVTPFQLTGQPLFRYDLVKLREDCYYWLLQYHHLIIDGYGVALLNRSLAELYTQLATGQSPHLDSPSYTTFIDSDRAYVASETFDKQRQYWLTKYPTRPEPLFQPRYRSQYSQPLIGSGCEVLYLPRDFYNRLLELAKQHNSTLFQLLLGALYVYFTRTAQRDDLAIGLPVLNRANAQFKQTAGLFTGVSPTWFKFGHELSFVELLQQIKKTLQANYRHQRFPVSEINRAVGLGSSRSQLFDLNLSFENHDNDAEFAGINGQLLPLLHHYEQTPLIIFVRDFHLQHDVEVDFVFNQAYFQPADIKALQARLVTILEAVLTDRELPIRALPIMTESELQQLQAWNDTAVDYPQDLTIVDLFEQQVARTPANIAVVFEEQQLTYQQLNDQANQLAQYLLARQTQAGIHLHNPLIAIAVERSLEMVIGLLGILKAGGAYVPIDPSYPRERLRYLLEDSAAPILLTQRHLQAQLPTLEHRCVVVCVDEAKWADQPTTKPDVKSQAGDLAYVIYTSGSTGKPKGVMVEQSALCNFVRSAINTYSLTSHDHVLQFAAVSFDAAAEEIYPTLLQGATLILRTQEMLSTTETFLSRCGEQQITVLDLPTAYWYHLLTDTRNRQPIWPKSIRLVLIGGEAVAGDGLKRWQEQFGSSPVLFNTYGPTETTVVATLFQFVPLGIGERLVVPIGHPIANTRIYILDAQHQPQPPGLPGELCIAGRGLARGYLNRPELTAEKFIEVELFGKAERVYKTGDLARWLPDGNLEYLGRLDHQVKLRGFRIELGEIEAVLSQHEAIKEVVVILNEADGNKRLVAYLTTATEVPPAVLTECLKARLPDYMIPSQWVVLEKLPLTPNGKIDRQALPSPVVELTRGAAPATPTEALLATLWTNVLKREPIQRQDNFFELGGHSLLATQLVARIRDSFQVELPVRAVFEHPQLADLSTALETATGRVRLPPIVVQPATATQVLSFAQQRLWFLNQLEDWGSSTYNMPVALRLSGPLAVAALQHSLHWLVARHDSLRTVLPTVDGQAQVRIQSPANFEVLRIQDLRSQPAAAQPAAIQRRINQHALAPFDLAQGPLFKAELLLLEEQQAVLLLNWHHIISDGWSMGVFIREWQHAYTAFSQGETPSLPPLAIQYQDYAAWQRQWLQGEVLQQQLEYWRNQLAGLPEVLDLPTDKPRPAQPSYQGADYAQSLATHLTSKLTQLSQQQGVTVFMTWLSAFYLLLSRYARQDDIAVGSPIANRTHSQTENLLGFFVNTLVLRGRLSPRQTFLELLRDTRHTCLAAYAHQDLPFEMLVEQLQPTRSLSHSPLFQVMLVLQNNDPVNLALPGLEITALEPDYPLAKFDLTLSVEEREGQFHCSWEYATDLFAADTIARMADHLVVLLTAIVENPAQVISQLPMLTDSEIQQLQAWNDTAVAYPQDLTIVDLFEQQVAQTPDNIAVVFEEQQLTYQQLNDQANQLAQYLLARQTQAGISTHNPLIAIAVERSLEMVIGLLGILKAGGAYVPIDPSYPRERLRYLLEDSAAPLLLTQSHLQAQLPTLEPDCVVVYLDEVKWANQSTTKPAVKNQAEDLAYVIYTSGSTGKPKGVMVEHKGLVNLALSQINAFRIVSESRILQFASFSFDAAVSEMITTLLSGAALYLVLKARLLETAELMALVVQEQITHLTLPPTWLSNLPAPACSGLKTLVVAGEACSIDLVKQWANRVHFINAYGPTENTVCATMALGFSEMESPHIGKPIANTRIYILDAQHQPQPPGLPGELCIAGRGLARGYLHRPELTAEKFIEIELFGKPERVYKTGDLARWLPDGNLEYLGRLDHQVKLRGFRIELGEIEAVLSQHEAVKEAVVTLNEAEGNPRLVAYLTTAVEVPTAILKEWLKARLPDYMIPSQWVVLEKLPLTPNGKIDRQALPSPVVEVTRGAAPATPTEALLATLWANVLKRETIQRQDNFFELGGHSLLATQLVARIRDSFQVELPVRAVFEHPQLADLSTAIETATGRVRLPPIVVQPATVTNVLSFAQQRLWFLNQLEERGSSTYNMPAALRLSGPLAVAALQDSLHWLVARHDSLRTVLPTVAGQAQVRIQALANFEVLRIQDLRSQPAEAQPAAIQRRINQHALAPFDLAQGPLFKAELLLLEEQQAVLLLNWHHIISDGWSMGVFLREWQQAYTAFSQGETPSLPPLAIQYQDYAAWQRQWLQGEVLQQQLEYWRNQLAGLPEVLDWPTDKPRPAQPSYQGAHYAQSLSTHLTSKLTQLSQQQGVTVFMTWLSAFYLLLSRYARQDDLAVGSPIANRTHSQTENLLGFFVNTLVLRGRLSPQQTFMELLRDTRHTCLAAYAHQDLPFEMLVEQLQPTRSLSHSPLFQVMLVLQNNDPVNLALPGLEITALEPDYPLAKFDLTLSVEEREGQFHCSWEYATDLFAADTIARMADHLVVLLTAIVENPTQVISRLPMLTESELQQLQAWNDTAVDYPQDLTIVDLFEQQVARTPANIAVVFEDQHLTYQQLNDQANQLAHYLLARQTQAGIHLHNPLIAIAVERSIEMVIGLLGILKAGGAYVPIDPNYPRERLRYLLEDSAAPLLLTQSHLQAQLPTLEPDCVVVYLDEVKWANQSTTKPAVKNQAEDLAYVIYTSGSTGKPKGVMIEQRQLANSTLARTNYYQNHSPKFLLLTSFAFDSSVAGIFGSLTAGAELYLSRYTNDLQELSSLIRQYGISQLLSVPTWYAALLESHNDSLQTLKTVIVAGESSTAQLLAQHENQIPQARLFNEYGPTEGTVWSSVYEYQRIDDLIDNIGHPIANTRIYILDAQHQPQPPGLPGELCIAGRGLARGYLHRPELTAEKFIEVELFGKPERVYKTGDLARWLPDGNLEYLGRLDHQVKLRGFRIELGEIEAVLSQHEAVKEVVVTLNEADGNPRLVAYLTTAAAVPTAGLKEWLKARLPDYMVPSQFVVLEKLPLTPNGKIDRKALPAPDWKPTDSYEAPRNEIEQQLAQIWSRLLKQTNVSIHDNFFNLGGDSILSIQIVAQARQAGFQLTPRDLFQHQTIADLATVVRVGVTTVAEPNLIGGEVPLTPIQHWFFAQEYPEYWHFNQSLLLRVPPDLQLDALRQAFAAVLLHHDALRCRYTESNGAWQQTVSAPADHVPLVIEDLCASPDPVAELSRLTQDYQARLNLTTGPVTYLVFFNGPAAAWLFWCIHHLVVDGVSWRILQADLQQAYTQLVAGQRVQLPAKTSSFQAWAKRLVQYASSAQLSAEVAYWQALPNLSVPRDNPLGDNRLEHQQNYTITLTPQETEALLREVPVAYQTRINDVLLTALALALADWTGQDRCLLDLEGHGRVALFEELDLSRTVGWFTTIYPVALTLPTRADLGTALKAIKEQLRGIPHDGIGYGLLTQLGGQVLPKGEILFNYLGQFDLDTDTGRAVSKSK